MTARRRKILGWLGATVGCVGVFYGGGIAVLQLTTKAPHIADFNPSVLEGRASSGFFYSIDRNLKYGDRIDPRAGTLASGEIRSVLPAPDGRRALVVLDGNLVIADAAGGIEQIVAVDSTYRDKKPAGEPYFRDAGFQWSRDSKSVYLIKDHFIGAGPQPLYSPGGELWTYDLGTREMRMVLAPFPASRVFLDDKDGFYFHVPADDGDLALKHFDGAALRDVAEDEEDAISRSAFHSFSPIEFAAFRRKDRVAGVAREGRIDIEVDGSLAMSVIAGRNFKGPVVGLQLAAWNGFLPGDRYYLLNLQSKQTDGQLLLDLATREYMPLPARTRIYPLLNTDLFPSYRLTSSGIDIATSSVL